MNDKLPTSSKYDYTTVQEVFTKIDRDYGMDNINEGDAIEQIGEALAFIGVVGQYEEAIAFIEVRNHTAAIPGGGCQLIHQIARNNQFDSTDKSTGLCPAEVVASSVEENINDEVDCPIVIDCLGQPLQEYELAYYRPYYDLKFEHDLWNTSRFHNHFTPVIKATDNFFATKGLCDNEINKYDGRDQYQLIAASVIRLSFCEGQIAVLYDRTKTDKNGYPMIPDQVSFIAACSAYVIMMAEKKAMYKRRDGSVGSFTYAERDWDKFCSQAACFDLMPKGEDELQNLANNKNRLIPRTHDYYSFFGNLNRPEERRFNNPNYRNKTYGWAR